LVFYCHLDTYLNQGVEYRDGGSFAKVGQVIESMKVASYLPLDMVSKKKKNAVYGIV